MQNAISLSVAALIAVAVFFIGCFYLVSPERMVGSFGLKLPSPDADTRAWPSYHELAASQAEADE